MEIESSRLILRNWLESDLEDLFEYAKQPEIGPMAGWKTHENIEESGVILKSFLTDEYLFAIYLKEEEKVIGSIGFKNAFGNNSKNKEIGFVLNHNYWGKGFMTESIKNILNYGFESLDLDIVSVAHFPHNARSKNTIQRFGFKYDGTIRQCFLPQFDTNIVYDIAHYSITKKEFYEL